MCSLCGLAVLQAFGVVVDRSCSASCSGLSSSPDPLPCRLYHCQPAHMLIPPPVAEPPFGGWSGHVPCVSLPLPSRAAACSACTLYTCSFFPWATAETTAHVCTCCAQIVATRCPATTAGFTQTVAIVTFLKKHNALRPATCVWTWVRPGGGSWCASGALAC